MKNIIEMDHVIFSKGNDMILNSICLEIKQGEFVCIVGENGAGKSSLIRVLLGIEKYNMGSICIFNKELCENRIDILSRIGFVAENLNNSFATDKVIDELSFSLKKLHLSDEEIQCRIKEIVSCLSIDDILNCIPSSLSVGQKQLVSLATALVMHPDILIVDESLDTIDFFTKEKLLSLFKKLCKDKKLTILYTTNDLEDTLYTDRVILLSKGSICLDEKTKIAYKNEKAFQLSGLTLPFMVDLSKKLQYYDLIDKIEYNMDTLVAKLWK